MSMSTFGSKSTRRREFIPRMIGTTVRVSTSSEISLSDQSPAIIESRVSHLEDKLTSMKVNIGKFVSTSIEELLRKYASR